ncbi:hypothetical protein Anas_11800 [Armadillidium nasatum]|uniref:Uncharacterized protein n=1 Tax=Armadillidium nasatum TaxID=96803 RepID=A0A5N5SP96_9CRUS|nr:hypothetical protein Anas_11800 [Armadillidium nasatum]
MRLASQSENKNYDGDYEEDEVFAMSLKENKSTVKTSSQRRENVPENSTSEKCFNRRPSPNICCARWSISNRCFDCAWISQREGRPAHPLPSLSSPSDNSSTLVTLKSLGRREDSGYEPSPTSLSSFSFASDDEDGNGEVFSDKFVDEPSTDTVDKGERFNKNIQQKDNTEGSTKLTRSKTDEAPKLTEDSPKLKRSKSLPELWSSEKILSRTPIMVRNDFLKTPSTTPVHGRNCSLPVTTSDGKPVFVTPSTNLSQEGLIDLTKYKKGKSTGHNCRVLVLALPDILVDVKGKLLSSSKTPTCSKSSGLLVHSNKRGELSSTSSTPSSYSSELYDSVSPRPTWRRPRALSCDVTIEVEFGQELRRIADNFTRKSLSREGTVWGAIRRGFERRFSLGENNRIGEILEDDRISHSLP